MLRAEDLIFCMQVKLDIESIRRPWQERRIGPPIPSLNGQAQDPRSTSTPDSTKMLGGKPLGNFIKEPFSLKPTTSGVLTVKESDEFLQQFISVVQFLEKMKIDVSWWQFKPSWAGLRQNNQVVLVDWTQGFKSESDSEFDPQYAIHLLGLGFSDIVPDAFQDSGRVLADKEGHTVVPIVDEDILPSKAPQEFRIRGSQTSTDRKSVV